MKRTVALAALAVALPALSVGAVASPASATTVPTAVSAVAANDNWPVVDKGDKGADVTAIQYLLSEHGYNTDADGDFGGGTEANVIKFQRANGLDPDGEVGPKTWTKLIVTVKKGSKGNAVKAAQVELKANGQNVAVDGDFGSGTESATKAFQSNARLSADGVIGPDTWNALVLGLAGDPGSGGSERQQLARWLLDSPATVFLRSHPGGNDHYPSTAGGEIEDTAAGRPAQLSPWGDAYKRGQHTVALSLDVLRAMKKLNTEKGYRFRVTEIAGGDHSTNSKHYKGKAFDVDTINGVQVSGNDGHHAAFERACRDLGADEVLGPGDAGHDTHVHCGWN
jgi:zinc D-Ala-D-Ala carboxypeptidase